MRDRSLSGGCFQGQWDMSDSSRNLLGFQGLRRRTQSGSRPVGAVFCHKSCQIKGLYELSPVSLLTAPWSRCPCVSMPTPGGGGPSPKDSRRSSPCPMPLSARFACRPPLFLLSSGQPGQRRLRLRGKALVVGALRQPLQGGRASAPPFSSSASMTRSPTSSGLGEVLWSGFSRASNRSIRARARRWGCS